jgi:hypothetical protein
MKQASPISLEYRLVPRDVKGLNDDPGDCGMKSSTSKLTTKCGDGDAHSTPPPRPFS